MEWLDEIRAATDELSFALLDAIEELDEILPPVRPTDYNRD